MVEKPLQILKENWGYDSFRGIQADIVASILAGHDTLGLMPTGGGKSITFQVPALCMEGICIVVTPLIALMKDQVLNLRRRNILAASIHSGMSVREVNIVYANCIHGHTKFLYVSPERLENETFQHKLKHMNVSLITVDEAHCISQWGYDFRPSYTRIREIRRLLPEVPVLALTATATPAVVEDICRQLDFRDGYNVLRMSFARDNLIYVVREAEDKFAQLLHIIQRVAGSAIVYTRSREGTTDVARFLESNGVKATDFHAGMSMIDKDVRQRRWLEGETRVMVATNAFGMGIDKPDVRLVIHMDIPDSIEAYFQEAGRGGRDGKLSWAVMLYNRSDLSKMKRHAAQEFPPREFCMQIYEELAYFFQIPMGEGAGRTHEFNIGLFCRNFRHYPVGVESALRLLTRAGYITYRDEDEGHSRIIMLARRDDLYYDAYLTPLHDRVLKALLRLYSGLFAEYVFIEEDAIAEEAGLSRETVYNVLLQLTKAGILNYVPRTREPRISYERRRIEARHLLIGRDIYEDRRDSYMERLEAMMKYVTQTSECRSTYMLRYFGEKNAQRCHHCDICTR